MASRGKSFDPNVKLSKALSYLLRHGAEKEGFKFQPGGFLYVDEILKKPKFRDASVEKIKDVVENNDKKRFTLEEEEDTGRLKIRANQGHSLEVNDLQLTPITNTEDFPVVIHGTNQRALPFIMKQGLSKMTRNHIHFAAGMPQDDGVISDGYQFFLSANRVILSPGNEEGFIPTRYFSKVIDRHTGKKIPL